MPVPRGSRTLLAVCAATLLSGASAAYGYSWPVKPFHKPHAIRGAFDDPRFHLGPESELSAFHFGVDIAAKDGAAVYAVAPGYVHARSADVTVQGRTGRAFGYWHVRPVVQTGQRVRLHQLLGHVIRGWGHVHFAEAIGGAYRNPLRPHALTPFVDHAPPVVGSIGFFSAEGTPVQAGRVSGSVDVRAEVYDLPPVPPAPPWQVARLTPAFIWWRLEQGATALTDWNLEVDFHYALLPASLYGWIYAPGTYQNKANRPGNYLFWVARGLDTTSLADGRYRFVIRAGDTRWNVGAAAVDFTIANGGPPAIPGLAPGMASRWRKPV